MSFKTEIKLTYLFGELEADVKRLQKKDWLNQSDLQLVLKEYEDIKEKYLQIYKNHNEEIAIQLISRMKEIPVDTFLKNKDKFLLRFEEWKKKIKNVPEGSTLNELLKVKELLDNETISNEEFNIIKNKLLHNE